jgi:hypothetical protein
MNHYHFKKEITVNRTPEFVWNFFMDITNLPKWDRGVARVEITSIDPSAKVGATFDTIGFRERGRMSYRVTEIDSVRHSNRVVTNSGVFKEAEWHLLLEPAEGGTRVICAVDFSLRPQYFILGPILYFNQNAIMTDLEFLKRILEKDTVI